MTDWFLRTTQRLLVGPEARLARQWQRRLESAAARERLAFERSLAVSPTTGSVVVGSVPAARGSWKWIGLPSERLLGLHAAIAGATGGGKSSWLLGILAQVLQEARSSVIVYDAKGETAETILKLLVPFLLEREGGEGLLGHLRVVDVFDPENVPLLNVTKPEAGVPREAQAYGVASAVEQGLAEPLGGRMHHVLVRCVTLCIELGWPLTRVQEWLEQPAAFPRAAEQSSDYALRQYARAGFRQESKESLRALGARLNALLFWPGARLALCAPGSVSFADALAEPGLTVINTGSPPAGAERLARFFGGILLGKIVRAILSRQVAETSTQALFVAEEIQESLGVEEARQLGRVMATARFKRTAIWLTSQSRSQISAIDPALLAAMRTNVGLQVQFRASPEDAAAFAHALPVDERGEPARRELISSLTRLPQRQCYLAVPALGLRAQLVTTPRIDFDLFRAAGGRLSPEQRRRIQSGTCSLPREDVIARQAVAPTPTTPAMPDVMPADDLSFPDLG